MYAIKEIFSRTLQIFVAASLRSAARGDGCRSAWRSSSAVPPPLHFSLLSFQP
jgi:hypothetical protein